MNPFIDLLDLAINSHLKQHEHQVLLVLLRQTLGFGKSADNLTNKRIAYDTKIRLDHCVKAILSLVDKGVFCREVSDSYDFRYTIPADIAPPKQKVYCPAIPDLPASNPHNLERTSKLGEELPNSGDIHCNTLTDCLSLQQQQESSTNTDKNVAPSDSKKVDKTVLLLPEVIEKSSHRTCYRALNNLSLSQCERVINTFNARVKTGKAINNVIGLFVYFCKLEASEGLPEPKAISIAASTQEQSTHPSHQAYKKPDPEIEAEERRQDDVRWLEYTSKQLNITVEELAKRRGMYEYL